MVHSISVRTKGGAQEDSELDKVYREWFDAATVAVHIAPEYQVGFLTRREVIELTGAPKNSTVFLSTGGKGIEFRVANPIFSEDMFRYLVQNQSGEYEFYLLNAGLVLKSEFSQRGIGSRCVIKEIFAAKRLASGLPIVSVEVSAVGNHASAQLEDDPMRGYYVWATMGFDGKIPEQVRPRLAEKFQGCVLVSDLMSSFEGRYEWFRCGESLDLSFSLADGSASWRVLKQYMLAKEVEL
jgi:hypothetical protein